MSAARSHRGMRIVGGVGVVLILVSMSSAQVLEIRTPPLIAAAFERRLGSWSLIEPVHAFRASEYEAYDPQRGAIAREYGLREAAFADYTDGRRTVRIELFRMINYVSAYGFYSFERRGGVRVSGIGTEAEAEENALAFWKGDYYGRVTIRREAKTRDLPVGELSDLARAFAERLDVGPHEIPLLIRHLPVEGRIPGSERFIAGPRGLAAFPGYENPDDLFLLESDAVEAAIAEYRLNRASAKLLLVEYHTPQWAKAAYDRVQAYWQRLAPAERDRRIFKREGNYLICAFDVSDRPTIERIVNQIEYTARVRWLSGDRIRLVPSIIEEFPVGRWLIAVFAFIGVLIVIAIGAGVLFGYGFFLWRRRRMQRYPFSDAGGIQRLNLDGLTLPSPSPSRQLPPWRTGEEPPPD
ncbi:hypothetical protein HRbin10_01587 [bacterium HR10]|uniref:Uncharacterized protein n=1 Tax=uncultured Acidobacteriota bacterium TaxID=171953 RepID=H5SPP0_9BACT|nr:hypothetical protein HGMM_F54F02C09 [uncultured Acidobacteriota bacterium]GBC82462.1 hypothetical protein HRbin10_01587 [bacterium HR10]